MRTPRRRPTLPVRLALLATAAVLAVPATAATATPSPSPTSPTTDRSVPAAVAAAATPGGSTTGWQVTDLGDGSWAVSWTSPRRLPTGSDRPTIVGDGLVLGPSTIAEDRRTVETVVTSAVAPDPADLDVLLSGDRLDERGSDPVTPSTARRGAVPDTDRLDAPDPGVAGPYAVTSSDYELPRVKLPGMPRAIEMIGHVVEPAADAATGPRPLVLFLHGRHGVCFKPGDADAYSDAWPCAGGFEEIPSHLGYDYVQQLLASQGFTTVSVRVNGINAQDFRLPDGGADARAAIVRRHLDHWASIAADHQVDLSRVVLVGHSRGGEGVDRASIQVPLDAPYRIVGQVLLAPTDFASHSAPYVPTVTVLPYCDGDVSDLQGQQFTDVGRDVVAGDTSLKSSVLVMGANHNFFNTEWTPGSVAPSFDDWGGDPDQACGKRDPGRLSAARQRLVGKAYVAAAVQVFTGDQASLPLLDGSRVSVASVRGADVRSHALGGGRDVRRPGVDATPTLAEGGAATRLCDGTQASDAGLVGGCGRRLGDIASPHWVVDGDQRPSSRFLEVSWTRAGAVGGLRFDAPLDLSTDRLELRTLVDPRLGPVDLRVRVTDGSGGSATLTPQGGTRLDPLLTGPYLTKVWGQSLLVDAGGATGVDLTDVRSVELVADSGKGRVWVADLAAAPAALAAVPAVRLPHLELGELVVDEGNPGNPRVGAVSERTAQIPFTVTGPLTRPARFVVVTVGQEIVEGRSNVQRFTVDVAPGQTTGSIPVDYTADNLDDDDLGTTVMAWPVSGLVTDDYLGSLTVRDDDPSPRISVSTPTRVLEGRSIVFRVGLDKPVGYGLSPYLETVRSPGRPLRGDDLVPEFVVQQVGEEADVRQPLFKLGLYAVANIDPGGRSASLVIPTARDDRREGAETLTVVIRVGRTVVRRAVTVVDR